MFARFVSLSTAIGCFMALGGCGGGGGDDPGPQPTTYTIGGTVTGYTGSGLVLQNNGGNNLAVSASGSFQFSARIAAGASYSVSILAQPGGQTCTVSNGSGTANADVTSVSVTCSGGVSATDTDGDGLSDTDELTVYYTSPNLPDTDGDGFSDKNEIDRRTGTNNFDFNPLIADLPQLKVEIKTLPIIKVTGTDSSGSSVTSTTERSQSVSSSTSTEIGASATVGVESTAEVGWSLEGPSGKASVSAYAESTVSWNQTSSHENQSAWSSASANGLNFSKTEDGGEITVGVTLSNPGNVDFDLISVDLSATQATNDENPYLPIGALSYDGATLQTTMTAGKSIPNLTFRKSNLDLGTTRQLLTQSRSVTVTPAIDNIKAVGTDFDYKYRTLDAQIVIDSGPPRAAERYWVAAQNVPGTTSHTLQDLLGNVLKISYTEGNGIETVRGVGANTAQSRWVVVRRRTVDNVVQEDHFDPVEAAYLASSIQVEAGDTVILAYLDDADGDRLGMRAERLYGTDPNNPDTDGDGLTDQEEVNDAITVIADNVKDAARYLGDRAQVHSSPLFADADGDGLSDPDEKLYHLDLTNPDTDGDGISDLTDRDNTYQPVYFNDAMRIRLSTWGDETDYNGGARSDFAVTVLGNVTATSTGAVVSEARIDWGDGSADLVRNTAAGGNPTLSIGPPNNLHTYAGAGTYTVTLTLTDNATPTPHVTVRTAQVVLTAATHPINDLGWSQGWLTARHYREMVDLDNDGYEDLVAIGGSAMFVAKGSSGGLQPLVSWGTGWATASVAKNPRLFADLDGDGFRDIIGVDDNGNGTATVRYALSNGGNGLGTPANLIPGTIPWNATQDSALMADIDGNGTRDFVHLRRSSGSYSGNIDYYLVLNNNVDVAPVVSSSKLVLTDRRYYPVEAADLNSDGCDELVVFGSSSTVYVHPADCGGTVLSHDPTQLSTTFDYDSAWRVETHKRWVQDIDNDGKPDIVGTSNSSVVVLQNISDASGIKFGPLEGWTTDFTATHGWREHDLATTPVRAHIYPRYLQDVNGDGYPDLVGYANAGAAVAYNMLGINAALGVDPQREFSPFALVGSAFDLGPTSAPNTTWSALSSSASACPIDNGVSYSNCREYFPRTLGVRRDPMSGKVQGAYLVGFDVNGVVEQQVPMVTPFH